MTAPRKLPAPTSPLKVARVMSKELFTKSGIPTLRHWRGGWWRWETSRWVELEPRAVSAIAYRFTEHAEYNPGGKKGMQPWAPNRHKIGDLLDALAAVHHLPESISQPSWIEGGHEGTIVSCLNGLLDVSSRELLEHTPAFFNQTAVPFPYDPNAVEPERWLGFLDQLWPDDPESGAVSRLASLLLVPYALWLAFATALTWAIWARN